MARLGLFWICATILSGCSLGGTTGELGNLAFWDETDNPEWLDLDHKVDRPIAQGAFIDITVKDAVNLNDLRNAKGGKVHSVSSATVDPSGVLSVVSAGEYVRLKADAVGSAKLNVITNGGIEDRVALEVAAVAKCGDLTVMHGSTVNLLLTVPEKMAPGDPDGAPRRPARRTRCPSSSA